MTQVDEVIRYIEENGSITQREAGLHLDCWRLSERIREAEAAGYTFDRKREPFTNKYGRHGSYVRYYLREAEDGAA